MYRLALAAICALFYGCVETSSMKTVDDHRFDGPRPAENVPEDVELPEMTAPRLVMTKKDRKLEVFDGETLVRTFNISLGFTPVGDKVQEGDGKTPEGEFYIYTKNPKSQFYLSLGVSYPGVEDAERGLRDGLISRDEYDEIISAVGRRRMPPQRTGLGGEIFLHGGGTGKDWTYGCAALADEDIRELFNAIPIGTPITILP